MPARRCVRRRRTVSTCVFYRCSLSSWRFQSNMFLGQDAPYMVFAWWRRNVLCACVLRFRLCLLVVFFALHHVTLQTSSCTVGWGGAENVQLELHSHVMRRSWTFSCSSTRTSCYDSARYAWGSIQFNLYSLKMLKMLLCWRCWRCCYIEGVAMLKMLLPCDAKTNWEDSTKLCTKNGGSYGCICFAQGDY